MITQIAIVEFRYVQDLLNRGGMVLKWKRWLWQILHTETFIVHILLCLDCTFAFKLKQKKLAEYEA